MITKNEIIEIIFLIIDEVNKENDINIVKEINTKLFGMESELDSLNLVGLIVSIEEEVNDKYDVSISIADEKAMSQKHSPFRSIETLADYILELLKEY